MTDKELVERLRLHANCMMDAAECKRCSILKRVETYTDTRTCTSCPLDGHLTPNGNTRTWAIFGNGVENLAEALNEVLSVRAQ